MWRHHADHRHPWFGPANGSDLTFTAPAPEDLSATENSYLEFELTATDFSGLTTTITQVMRPRTVRLTFATNPTGLQLEVAGQTFTAPVTITSWRNWSFVINAPSPQGSLSWIRWSDGGTRSHTITTPGRNKTYTARFG